MKTSNSSLLFVPLFVATASGFFCTTSDAAPEAKTAGRQKAKAAKPGAIARANVAGISISGLTPTEATRRLNRELNRKMNARLILTDGRRRISVARRYLGARPDIGWMLGQARAGRTFVPLRLSVDLPTLQETLERVAPRFVVRGRDARLIDRGGRVSIAREVPFSRLNIGASVPRIAAALEKNAATRKLVLATRKTQPRLTAARFRSINGRLGTFTTRFNASNAKRTQNMRIAIRAIDGTFVAPNAVFSLNKTVGERSQKRGYRTSIVFQNGYKVPGVGAGVSQVTGTIFNAALVAGLPIVEYRTHSQPVAYLPKGRDATVAWGSFDMKWKNNTRAPIYISYKVNGNRATATLYGKKVQGRRVSVAVRSQSKGPRHITSQLYRTIRQNGKVVSKQKVGSSLYKWKVGKWED